MNQKQVSRRNILGGAAAGAAIASIGFTRPALAAADPTSVITLMAGFEIVDGKRDEAIEILAKLTKAVEEKEPGVLAYTAHTPQDNPNQVIFFEVYDSQETFQTHGRQPHLGALMQAFGTVFKQGDGIKMLDRVAGFIR